MYMYRSYKYTYSMTTCYVFICLLYVFILSLYVRSSAVTFGLSLAPWLLKRSRPCLRQGRTKSLAN